MIEDLKRWGAGVRGALLLVICSWWAIGCAGGGSPSASPREALAAFSATDQQLGLQGANGSVWVFVAPSADTVTGSAVLQAGSSAGNLATLGNVSLQTTGGVQHFVAPPPQALTYYRVEAQALSGARIVSNTIRYDPSAATGAVSGLDPNGTTVSTTPVLRWQPPSSGAARYAVLVLSGSSLADMQVALTLPPGGQSPETLDLGAALPQGAITFRQSALPLASQTNHFWFVFALDASGAATDTGFAPFTTQ